VTGAPSSPSSSLLRAAVDGAGAGVVATVVMSVPMLAADRAGLMPEPPPETITDDALTAVGVAPADRTETQKHAAASLMHLVFGAGCGIIYTLLRRRARLPLPSWVQGVPFGLGVWAVSYKGWIPAFGILPPPSRDRPGRVRTMMIVHMLYGGVLGLVEERGLRRRT
jgi:hypothetical protein